MENTKKTVQEAIKLLPEKMIEQFDVNTMVVSQSSVSVLFNERNQDLVSSLFSNRNDYVEIQNYLFRFVPININTSIEKERNFKESAFCILILDADILLNECEQKVMQYMSTHTARKDLLIVMVLNTNRQPSKTAVELTIETSLRNCELNSPIIMVDDYSQEELYRKISLYIGQYEPNIAAINAEMLNDVSVDVCGCLKILLSEKEKELETLNERKVVFHENKELFTTFLNQLPLDLWLQLKRYYDNHLENDVEKFAKDASNAINEEMKTIDIKTIMPYFGLYLNYLWGQFLNHEMADAAEALTKTVNDKLDDLLDQYRKFFNSDVVGLDFKVEDITQAGHLPISLESPDEYNRVLQKVVERILDVFNWYSMFSGELGDLLYSWLCNVVFGRLGNTLLIRKNVNQLRRIYSDAVYHQFQDQKGLEEVKRQIQSVFIPVLEKNFKVAIGNITATFIDNLKLMTEGYTTRISEVDTEIKSIKEQLNCM